MRVAFVSTRSDAIGGSNVHIRDMSLALLERGHEVLVLGGGEGVFAEDVRSHGIEYIPLKHMVRNITPLTDLRGLFELRFHLKRFRPDLLSLHTAKAGVLGRLAGIGMRSPVIYTPHGWTYADGVPKMSATLYAFVERLLAPLATVIVNVCQADQELALGKRVGRENRHITIHNGMPDVEKVYRARPEKAPVRLVMIARFEEQKDHATLFNALTKCLDLDWHLDLIGTGPLEGAMRELAGQLDIADRVTFLGHRSDIAELLSNSQLFVLASNWEGFPRSVLEAMRAGLPVVTSRVGGVDEAVEHGVSGCVVPIGDAAVLSRHLRRLLGDAKARGAMGLAGRLRYERYFTFDQMLTNYLRLYERLVPGFSGNRD